MSVTVFKAFRARFSTFSSPSGGRWSGRVPWSSRICARSYRRRRPFCLFATCQRRPFPRRRLSRWARRPLCSSCLCLRCLRQQCFRDLRTSSSRALFGPRRIRSREAPIHFSQRRFCSVARCWCAVALQFVEGYWTRSGQCWVFGQVFQVVRPGRRAERGSSWAPRRSLWLPAQPPRIGSLRSSASLHSSSPSSLQPRRSRSRGTSWRRASPSSSRMWCMSRSTCPPWTPRRILRLSEFSLWAALSLVRAAAIAIREPLGRTRQLGRSTLMRSSILLSYQFASCATVPDIWRYNIGPMW